jgi:hypothetical protein
MFDTHALNAGTVVIPPRNYMFKDENCDTWILYCQKKHVLNYGSGE